MTEEKGATQTGQVVHTGRPPLVEPHGGNTMIRTAAAAFTLAATATTPAGAASPAGATETGTQHCPDHNSSKYTKVELGYETTKLWFKPGTVICVKAGTKVSGKVTVGSSGIYYQNFSYNKKGKAKAISYFVVYYEPTCPPKY